MFEYLEMVEKGISQKETEAKKADKFDMLKK